MSSNDAVELRLTAPTDAALQALLAGLPKDAVVREEEDGVGRFAGQRTVAIVARGRARVMLFEGTWGTLKPRLDTPMVDVAFEERPSGVVARITKEPQGKPGLGSHLGEFINRALTVAVAMVAYYWVQSLPVDYALVAGVAAGGGLAWTVLVALLPSKPQRGLDDVAREALAPLRKKKSKKAGKAEKS
ncbi:MAG: hypothetical protein KDK70_38670, partial [Myxococcales bacterium]|nr:hypothetical protein [Myxococcales bacterium]